MKYLLTICLLIMYNQSNLITPDVTRLKHHSWVSDTRERLETLIKDNAFQGKKVVIDFDNTILCGDVGESVFGSLVENNELKITDELKHLSPSFKYENHIVELGNGTGLVDYYNCLLKSTTNNFDETPHSTGYSWVVQTMSGMQLSTLINYTDKVMQKISEGNGSLFFYPEMIDLIGLLIRNGYHIYIVSASNVWSVRHAVIKYLNPLIREVHGKNVFIDPLNVYGMNTLLKHNDDDLMFKDEQLVIEKDYLNLVDSEIEKYTLTSLICYPATSYYGKMASIIKNITSEKLFLVAGDSPNDFPMLRMSENALWIARTSKTDYQHRVLGEIMDASNNWIIQPTLTKKYPGFVPSLDNFYERTAADSSSYEDILSFMELFIENKLIEGFLD